MKILITGGKSSHALKLLKAFSNDQIVLADYGEMPSFPSTEYQFISLGDRNDEIIAHNLLKYCLDNTVGLLLPLHVFEIGAVAKSTLLFEEFDIQVLLPKLNLFGNYTGGNKMPSKKWAVYLNGELWFASNPSDEQKKLGSAQELNGVFYISEGINGLEADLFII